MKIKKEDFGNDFQWGVTTAAYQIEGAYNVDGKGLSIWDEFTQKSGKIKDKTTGNIACDHYNRYREDVSIIKNLNFKNYRFSLSWSRILPFGTKLINPQGIDYYNKLIDTCLENGITPWITLYHWDLPLELQHKGGWCNREILNWFAEFTELCVKRFGDRVKNWIILNEPMVYTGAGYFLGYHAPGKKGLLNFLPAMHHATLAQGIGGRIVRDYLPKANIGTTFSCSYIEPTDYKPKNVAAARRFDALLNRLYIEPILGKGYPLEELPALRKVERFFQVNDEANMAFEFDFIGLQNYTREVIQHSWYVPYISGKIIEASKRGVKATTMGWEVYPESVYNMLHQYFKYKKVKNIIVTESGAAFQDNLTDDKTVIDKQRVKYFKEVLEYVLKAKQEGVNVNGYFVWSLLDNFEWSEGFTQRFGLVYTDYRTQERIIKNSGYWFQKFLASQSIKKIIDNQANFLEKEW